MQLLSAVKRELQNPPVTGMDATRDLEIKHMNRHKVKSHDFTRKVIQPFSFLPINILKKMSSYLHGSREHMGIFDMDKSELLVGTGFGIGSVGVGESVVEYCIDKNVPLMFHTHPTRKNVYLGMDFDWQLPSAPDYIFTQLVQYYCRRGHALRSKQVWYTHLKAICQTQVKASKNFGTTKEQVYQSKKERK